MWTLSEDERLALEASWLTFAISHADMTAVSAWWRVIEARYSEPHRHYHTLAHVRDMLQIVSGEAPVAATWFHDIVYDPTRSDNEDASARIAAEALRELGFSVLTIDVVTRMIRATATHEAGELPPQTFFFLDADLAVLGSNRERYVEYRDAIRSEYGYLSDSEFADRRHAVLRGFLSRRRIYLTNTMYERYERAARTNIEWEVKRAGRPGREEAGEANAI